MWVNVWMSVHMNAGSWSLEVLCLQGLVLQVVMSCPVWVLVTKVGSSIRVVYIRKH